MKKRYEVLEDCKFTCQINNIDHYQTFPTPLDRNVNSLSSPHQRLNSIPIIRIFGTTQAGQHAMVHVHGVYPYVYVEYKGSLIPEDGKFYFLTL